MAIGFIQRKMIVEGAGALVKPLTSFLQKWMAKVRYCALL